MIVFVRLCGIFVGLGFIFDLAPRIYFHKKIFIKSVEILFDTKYFNIIGAVVLVLIGAALIYLSLTLDEKDIDAVKCPKCKKSFLNSELKDGICPNCGEKTIEIEEYVKKYPEDRKYLGLSNDEIEKMVNKKQKRKKGKNKDTK